MNRFKKIQYDCHKATFLMEKRTMTKLTIVEHIELRIHLAGCSVCRVYKKQSILISQMVHQILYGNADKHHLSPDDKKAMENRIEDELKK